MVAVMEATGGGSNTAGGAFKTLGTVADETWRWACCGFTRPSVGTGLALAGIYFHFTPLTCVSRQALAEEVIDQRVAGYSSPGVARLVQALIHVPLTAQPHKAWWAGTEEASRFRGAGSVVVAGLGLTGIEDLL